MKLSHTTMAWARSVLGWAYDPEALTAHEYIAEAEALDFERTARDTLNEAALAADEEADLNAVMRVLTLTWGMYVLRGSVCRVGDHFTVEAMTLTCCGHEEPLEGREDEDAMWLMLRDAELGLVSKGVVLS